MNHAVSQMSQTEPASSSEPSELTTIGPISAAKAHGVLRGLYYWVLSWAHTRYGTPALFGISFAESSFFPIPPDVLQIALSVAKPRWSYYYAAVNAVGSVLGGVVGWLIGFLVWESTKGFFFSYVPGFSPDKFEYVVQLYQEHALLTIIGAAFTPIPYKIFTIAAGVCSVGLPVLILGSVIGRSARFLMVATAIFFFGEKVKHYLEKYLEIITFVMFVLLVAGFVAVKYLMH